MKMDYLQSNWLKVKKNSTAKKRLGIVTLSKNKMTKKKPDIDLIHMKTNTRIYQKCYINEEETEIENNDQNDEIRPIRDLNATQNDL